MTGEPISITQDVEAFKNFNGIRINYSPVSIAEGEMHIVPQGLLWSNIIEPQQITCIIYDGITVFFKTSGTYPFDIFSASFYLLTRYEEYLPFPPDEYGRYPHTESIAYKEGFLHLPVVNMWVEDFRKSLEVLFSHIAYKPAFVFLPTYDIDMAWEYRHKGLLKNMGGFFRDFFLGKWSACKNRIIILFSKNVKDPFGSYGWLNQLHEHTGVKPYYFFLVAKNNSRYDKNISPDNTTFKQLIQDHAIRYPVGLHPSWASGDDTTLLQEEKKKLEAICGQSIASSRQHYIRMSLPATYELLLQAGIKYDFSMGYGSINGFRASYTNPYPWYNLQKEEMTELTLFPFCYMDANSFYELRHSPNEALTEMNTLYKIVEQMNGYFIMIWHNTILGTNSSFAGWRDIYEQFIEDKKSTSLF